VMGDCKGVVQRLTGFLRNDVKSTAGTAASHPQHDQSIQSPHQIMLTIIITDDMIANFISHCFISLVYVPCSSFSILVCETGRFC
jgi:hypothetical protein